MSIEGVTATKSMLLFQPTNTMFMKPGGALADLKCTFKPIQNSPMILYIFMYYYRIEQFMCK